MYKKSILLAAAFLLTVPPVSFATPTTFKNTIESVKQQQDQIYHDIQQLDLELAEQLKKIREKEKQLSELNAMQQIFEKDMKEVAHRIEQREEFVKKRMVILQVEGQVSYLDVLLGANSLEDFLHRAYAINTLFNADKEIINTYKNDVNTLKELEGLLVEGKMMYEQNVKELQTLIASLEQQIKQKEAALIQLHEQEQTLKISYYDSLNQVDAPSLQKTTLIRPSAGYVSSEFGYRIHPIFKVDNYHKGVDIAIGGAAVELVAVADGVIEYAGYLGGYGYVVMIGHELEGHRFTTVYAHQQGIEVSVGQEVKQGDFIGYMGNSGNSTGQHLHFEIHVGPWTEGQTNAVNPRLYIDF